MVHGDYWPEMTVQFKSPQSLLRTLQPFWPPMAGSDRAVSDEGTSVLYHGHSAIAKTIGRNSTARHRPNGSFAIDCSLPADDSAASSASAAVLIWDHSWGFTWRASLVGSLPPLLDPEAARTYDVVPVASGSPIVGDILHADLDL